MDRMERFIRGQKESLNPLKTAAMENFEANLDPLDAMLRSVLAPTEVLNAMKSFERVAKRALKTSPNEVTPSFQRAADTLTTAMRDYVTVKHLTYRWISVMFVALLEGYLEDGLITLATKNPKVLRDAPPLHPQRALEIDSIEALRDEVRQQWAHNFLRPGGPETWLKRLRNIGARGYDPDAVFVIQHLWDTRNLIVHARGIASAAYARKYEAKNGEPIEVTIYEMMGWLGALKSFTICTDGFFLKYCA